MARNRRFQDPSRAYSRQDDKAYSDVLQEEFMEDLAEKEATELTLAELMAQGLEGEQGIVVESSPPPSEATDTTLGSLLRDVR